MGVGCEPVEHLEEDATDIPLAASVVSFSTSACLIAVNRGTGLVVTLEYRYWFNYEYSR